MSKRAKFWMVFLSAAVNPLLGLAVWMVVRKMRESDVIT